MRKYYYNEAMNAVYTEKEKAVSKWPASRFELIGSFKNRREAEDFFFEKYNIMTANVKRI